MFVCISCYNYTDVLYINNKAILAISEGCRLPRSPVYVDSSLFIDANCYWVYCRLYLFSSHIPSVVQLINPGENYLDRFYMSRMDFSLLYIQLLSKNFLDSDFCHNYLHTPVVLN